MINIDIIEAFDIDKAFKKHYIKVFSIIEKMEEIFKDTSFDEFDLLEEKDEKIAIELINEVIDEFVILSRKSSGEINWEKFKETWRAPDFWDAVMKKTKTESNDFIKMEFWRNMEDVQRKELFHKIFSYKYLENEDREFIYENVDINRKGVDSYLELLIESEKMIFLYSLSKRRYIGYLGNKFGIDTSDIQILWDLYEKNQKLIEKLVNRRVNNIMLHMYENLEKKIIALQQETNDLQDTMTYFIEQIEENR